MRALRRSRSPALAERDSLSAQARLTATDHWKDAKVVALYAAFRGELSVDGLMEQAWREGRAVYLPRVHRSEPGLMDFAPCASLAELAPSTFGPREPARHLPGFRAEDIGRGFRPDLLVAPGLAFDGYGMRLGFGGGYYDRFLRRLSHCCPCVGMCFEFQFVEKLPVDDWDCPVHYVCTESRFLKADCRAER
jgi:5-formyltetrahydrofolate cyclo-ligase